MNKVCLILFCAFLFSCFQSCRQKEKDQSRILRLVTEWQGKEILFPPDPVFTRYVTDTADWRMPESDYKVLVYVDSIGCTSCKLQLNRWKEFMATVDSVTNKTVSFLFYFQSTDYKELRYILRQDRIDFPVCIDTDDRLNKLNNFPPDMTFQTFLLDKDNKVVVIGNPIHNLSVKDLYLKQIMHSDTKNSHLVKTAASVEVAEINLGTFDKSAAKTAVFAIKNTGNNPLVIIDVATTCGCAYPSFEKKPANPGEELQVTVVMCPKESGFFDETITVKCNTEQYIKLKIHGQAG